LFAAFLSAFLLFAITELQPDSIELSKDILLHISLQLSNSSVPPYVEPEFNVSSSVATVNILLFTSLALILIDAYLAMLTKSWLRDFDRNFKSSNVPKERATAREMRFQGLKRWKLSDVVTLLPLLIQASLILFCIALVIILFNLHRPTAYSTLIILAAGLCFHFSVTVISVLDANAPFASPVSGKLRKGIQMLLNCCSRGDIHDDAEDAESQWCRQEKTDVHLAIYDRLYAATSKEVENIPVFTSLFDQWMHTPSLRPRSMSDWREVLFLVQPPLLNASLPKEFGLRSVARLFLCSNSGNLRKGRKAVIDALEKNVGDIGKLSSIEGLYIHLLRQPDPDWSLAGQVIRRLDADRDTVIELRWIINWICFRFLIQSNDFPNTRDLSWASSMKHITFFLRNTAVYIIQNRMMNDEHKLFHSLLLITRSLAEASKETNEIHGRLFVSIGDPIPPQSQWEFVCDLYAAPSSSAAAFKRDFNLLVTLLMISALGADEHSDHFTNFSINTNRENVFPALMDGLWETWRASGVDQQLLIRTATRLLCFLGRPKGPDRKALPNKQDMTFQDLLHACDSHINGPIPLMTPNGLEFIELALVFGLEAAKASNEDSKWALGLRNPWLVMHVHNIQGIDWCFTGSAMREVVGGGLERLTGCTEHERPKRLRQLERLSQLKGITQLGTRKRDELVERLNRFEWLNRLERLNRLDWLDRLDDFTGNNGLKGPDELDKLGWAERSGWRGRHERHEWLEWREWLTEQNLAAMEIIARRRLDLYQTRTLRPDPVALSLFLSQRGEDISRDSRRLLLELFRSSPSTPSPPPSNATNLEADTATAQTICSDFFDSKAIGDVMKWRMLASVVFPEWETLSVEWKDLLATEMMKVDYQDGKAHRADWMARVTPLLEGEFNLYEFGLASEDSNCGQLTPKHLEMIATVVEYLRAERLYKIVGELDAFLEQYSNILCDATALRRIRKVIGRARILYDQT